MQKEKGKICVSIIVPTHRLSPDRRVDKAEVERAITSAKELVDYKYSISDTTHIKKALDDLFYNIDFSHNAEGLGLYVSNNIQLSARFKFPVEEKIMVGDNFEIRDLLYKIFYSKPYRVLLLTEKDVRFFKGSWNELNEVRDEHFPKEYEEDYIYERPSRSTPSANYAPVRNFEKEKSVLEEIRFKDFFREADKLLTDYLPDEMPLILLGSEKEMEWFWITSSHKQNIIQKISGNYNYLNEKELGEITWPAMHLHQQQENQLLLEDFKEKVGEHLGISGIHQVWKAVKEGKALKLLVEKDFRKPGFVNKDGYQLYLQPPKTVHRIITDAVDDIIEMVLEKNGQVYFMDKDMLKDYEHIALITRY